LASNSPVLGVTIGDPAGIGPEVALRALKNSDETNFKTVVIARHELLTRHYPGLTDGFGIAGGVDDVPGVLKKCGRVILDVNPGLPLPSPGHGSINTGIESRLYIDTAVELWRKGIIGALVTGPVSKELIGKSGCPFTGHTEYLAAAVGGRPYMMMFSAEYRVILATTHIPVSGIPGRITAESLYRTIMTGNDAVSSIDGVKARLAIAGLDPHCGDGGAIGDFDMRITAAAAERARGEGIDIEGPFSADTLFLPSRWKSYSLVIAQYHDQGLIPFKMLSFDSGVNVTLGLELVRTSVDHGTAFDIAGRGIAGHRSMSEAMRLACRLLERT
jgi:4-phospho-D-threonate 3-dehydrogenase / 4-phospho-D-erythronate 3-dehydrogenase